MPGGRCHTRRRLWWRLTGSGTRRPMPFRLPPLRMHMVQSLFLLLVCALPAYPQRVFLDTMESLAPWRGIHSHGDASRVTLTSDSSAASGRCLHLHFDFIGYMGSVAAERKFGLDLPENFTFSFDIRGRGPRNNLILRFIDSLDNVWIVINPRFELPGDWTTLRIRKNQIQYGWGPSGGGDLRHLDRIEMIVDVVDGGTGDIWLDNVAITARESGKGVTPVVDASSMSKHGEPFLSDDGSTLTGWHSNTRDQSAWISFDPGSGDPPGGIVIEWDGHDFPRAFEVQSSGDGTAWTTVYAAVHAAGGKSYIPLPALEARMVRIVVMKSHSGKGFGIHRLVLKGPEFSFSANDMFRAIAADNAPGRYPKYFLDQQSYWTVIGASADEREGLINEQGMIEVDKMGFSLEPFVYVDSTLVTWHDGDAVQSLERGYLPIPSVRWEANNGWTLSTTAFGAGTEGASVLVVRYLLRNTRARRTAGTAYIALRPFQVNPPWETFTIIGGVSRIASMRYDSVVAVDGKTVIPVTRPDAFGCTEFDQGDITTYLAHNRLPASQHVADHTGFASGALAFHFDLGEGEQKEIILAVPFHDATLGATMKGSHGADEWYAGLHKETVSHWEHRTGYLPFSLPPAAPPIADAVRSNLAWIMINADGPGIQPGSRSYERSWIRDGALTAVAMLQMGMTAEVRRYLDWYAEYQYPNGMIPAVVESRGPEPTPENDSHGQFIYAILQYFRFTQDTAWLRGKWEHIRKTVGYIHSLRALRKTDRYRNGTPVEQACYGLVPESISHEGYSWQPQHSYWDDFFTLRGLKDATTVAAILGLNDVAGEFAAERDDFHADLSRSIRLAMKIRDIRFVPGCVELGDFSGLSTTVAVSPCAATSCIPDSALSFTFDESYRMFVERKNSTADWGAYLPYEWRFVDAYVHLGERDRAVEIARFLMRDRRPEAWNHWAEVVWKDRTAPKNIGDMPHTWAGSDFIRAIRSMLAYERESDGTLVIAPGIPEEWLGSEGVHVTGLPTWYGRLHYTMQKSGDDVVVELTGDNLHPPGGFVVCSPRTLPVTSFSGPGKQEGNTIVVDQTPARIVLHYTGIVR